MFISSTDQLGKSIQLNSHPGRIVSVVPSITELLYDLGLNEEVVGITKFCIHPAGWFNVKTKIGGTKNLNINKINELKPDLIIAAKEENEKSQIEELAQYCPVWTADVKDLNSAIDMINSIGSISGRTHRAHRISTMIRQNFDLLPVWKKELSVAYLIWNNPMMIAGGDSFINSMLKISGLRNVFEHLPRYPEVSIEDIRSGRPQFIMLSSEPFPFSDKHLHSFKQLFPESEVILVDGAMFSWYGSRLIYAGDYFRKLMAGNATRMPQN